MMISLTPNFSFFYPNQLTYSLLQVSILVAASLIVPSGLLGPSTLNPFVSLQVSIILTGNYSFFNLLTLALCLALADDDFLLGWIWKQQQSNRAEHGSLSPHSLISKQSSIIPPPLPPPAAPLHRLADLRCVLRRLMSVLTFAASLAPMVYFLTLMFRVDLRPTLPPTFTIRLVMSPQVVICPCQVIRVWHDARAVSCLPRWLCFHARL